MKLNLHVKASVDGKVVHEKEHDPWCVGVTGLLHGYRFCVVALTIRDVGNVDRSWATATARMDAGSGNNLYGLVVGTGSTAHAWSNFDLGARIAHGTGSGQLSYGATSFNAPQTSGNERFFEVVRIFTNLSGAAITVNEIGMIIFNGANYFLACRDVIGGGIAIPNGQALTLTYKLKITL